MYICMYVCMLVFMSLTLPQCKYSAIVVQCRVIFSLLGGQPSATMYVHGPQLTLEVCTYVHVYMCFLSHVQTQG